MDTREVTHVRKDENGTIVALGHPGKSWSPRSKKEVVLDIDKHSHSYFIRQGEETADIITVHPRKYVRAKAHGQLSKLPELPEDGR